MLGTNVFGGASVRKIGVDVLGTLLPTDSKWPQGPQGVGLVTVGIFVN